MGVISLEEERGLITHLASSNILQIMAPFLRHILDRILASIRRLPETLALIFLYCATLPYYRYFEFNTLGPIRRLAECNSRPDKQTDLVAILTQWRERKTYELQFVLIACTVLAAAVIGSFSWNSAIEAYWLATACWYSSLFFSVLGILLSAQQAAIFHLLGPIPRDPLARGTGKVVQRYLPLLITGNDRNGVSEETGRRRMTTTTRNIDGASSKPRWHMVFTWQCPVMFMSYSVCTFLLGLTVLVITPLIHVNERGWTGDATVAVIYLVMAGISGVIFVLCSFWIYHYVQLDGQVVIDREEDEKGAYAVYSTGMSIEASV